jgi:hypothetical protein
MAKHNAGCQLPVPPEVWCPFAKFGSRLRHRHERAGYGFGAVFESAHLRDFCIKPRPWPELREYFYVISGDPQSSVSPAACKGIALSFYGVFTGRRGITR